MIILLSLLWKHNMRIQLTMSNCKDELIFEKTPTPDGPHLLFTKFTDNTVIERGVFLK